jgi:hypothetical protein
VAKIWWCQYKNHFDYLRGITLKIDDESFKIDDESIFF